MADSNVKEEKHITYDAIKIGLASPEKIREWSRATMLSGIFTRKPARTIKSG